MIDQELLEARQAMVNDAADFIGRAMQHLHQEHGLPWELIAVGAHAQAVAAMAEIVGGPATAQCCERAAERVRNLPSAAAMALAVAVPVGRA
jgi:hypothetical protein